MQTVQLPARGGDRTMRGLLRPGGRRRLRVGSAVEREWHGRRIRVRVVKEGYEMDGEVYGSLSAIARAVTGTRWSGPLFFGPV